MSDAEKDLEVLRDWPETEVCRLLGQRVRDGRKAVGETQVAFAARAGVPLRTFKRLEKDGSGTLETFVRVLRALGRSQYLMALFPHVQPMPQPVSITASMQRLEATLMKRAQDADEPLVVPSRLRRPPRQD